MGVFVGIDVSKAQLDVYVHPTGVAMRLANTAAGLRTLTQRLLPQTPVRIVLEASGGYEQAALDALHVAGLPVVRVNPRQARDFAKASGQLAKTDALDAKVLAAMAAAGDLLKLEAYVPRTLWQRQLAELQRARSHMRDQLSNERQFLATLKDAKLRHSAQARIRALQHQVDSIQTRMAEQVKAQPSLTPLASIKGIGLVAQATLAALLPELGRLDGKAAAKLVGVAPLNRDSGTLRGKRSIWGGRAQVRAVLYMATLSVIRYEPALRDFYTRLRARGKVAKTALVAVMRKLVVILNARMRDARTAACVAT